MQIKRKEICPLIRKKCIRQDCMFFMAIRGTDPQDKSKTIDEWGCAHVWNVTVGLEIVKRVSFGLDGVQKATESFRNEMVRLNEPPQLSDSANAPKRLRG